MTKKTMFRLSVAVAWRSMQEKNVQHIVFLPQSLNVQQCSAMQQKGFVLFRPQHTDQLFAEHFLEEKWGAEDYFYCELFLHKEADVRLCNYYWRVHRATPLERYRNIHLGPIFNLARRSAQSIQFGVTVDWIIARNVSWYSSPLTSGEKNVVTGFVIFTG